MLWIITLASAACSYGIKLVGLCVPRRALDNRRIRTLSDLLPVSLLAALIATQTITAGHHMDLDARALGVACAGVAAWRRAPFLVIVALAAVVTALARLVAA
jgi:branched-subunit amino acid transport protein